MADDVRHSSSNSSNGSNGVDNVSLSFDVGIMNSDNVLEFLWFFAYETLTHTTKYL